MLVRASDAVVFGEAHATFTGLAAPSRGSAETSVWRVTLKPGAPALEHSMDREEVFVGLAGRARASVGGTVFEVGPGDALIVPAGQLFGLANPTEEPFEAIAVLPVGGRAMVVGGEAFVPPWAE